MSKKCKTSVNGCKKSFKMRLFVGYMKRLTFSLLSCALIFVLHSCQNYDKEFSEKVKVSLRNVGHELLLSQKDSTSLVLPVERKDENQYQLTFQNELLIHPDSLVTIVKNNFVKAELPQNYRVEVHKCETKETAYSFEMFYQEEKLIVPCSGRSLPNSCYTISIRFLNNRNWSTGIFNTLLIVVLIPSIFMIFIKVKRKTNAAVASEQSTRIGSFLFYPMENKLVHKGNDIALSKKECELLVIFSEHLNQIVKREELTKKVWEDHGVFVGRSLDTYISKIRKKLKEDDSIRLVNVHGVGYKLEVD
jgi:hypothetical protein